MQPKAILSLDQGTTSTRAIVFDKDSNVICAFSEEHHQYYPAESYVEHDAEEIWQNTLKVCSKALKTAQNEGFDVTTMGITNQRETIVAWHKDSGKPLAPAIVWQDRRTTHKCVQFSPLQQAEVQQKTGLSINPYFSASKIQFLLEKNVDIQKSLQNNTLCIGTIDSYLLYRLTNGKSFYTDVTNASRTLLFNIHTLSWDQSLCQIFNVPIHILPQVSPNTFNFGETAYGLLPKTLPIQAMIGDQQAATVGQTCFQKGELKSTYGTGNFIMLNTGSQAATPPNGCLTTILFQTDSHLNYAIEGSAMICGSAIQWLRDKIQLIDNAQETEYLAQQANPDDHTYFVPALIGLGAPYWNNEAKGQFTGLSINTSKADIVRAVLDSLCYQTFDLLTCMNASSTTIKVDGGLTNNSWFLQRLADLCQIHIVKPKITETTALGAAYLSGLQAGIYKSFTDIKTHEQIDQIINPILPKEQQQYLLKGWEKSMQQCLNSTKN